MASGEGGTEKLSTGSGGRSAMSIETHRWNIEVTVDGLRVCDGEHHRSQDCDWVSYVPKDRVDTLAARLAEYEEAHRITVNDCGAPDEQHCSCVPSLRLEAKRLQARLTEATGLVREMLPYVGLCLRAHRAGPASDIDAMNDLMSRAGGVLAADSAPTLADIGGAAGPGDAGMSRIADSAEVSDARSS
jgi:hypothetical protein